MSEEKQWLAVPYEDRAAVKALGAKWDWREKLWYIGSEGTREGLARWLPENAARRSAPADPRDEFADVLRELGGDLSGEHPIMDGRPHRMATLDDDRGEKSIFYVAHADGRPGFVCADVALILGILELVFADVLPKLFGHFGSGEWVLGVGEQRSRKPL